MKDMASRKVLNSKDASTFEPLTDQSGKGFNPASISDFVSILCFVIACLLDNLSHLHKSLCAVHRIHAAGRLDHIHEFSALDQASLAIMAHVCCRNNDRARPAPADLGPLPRVSRNAIKQGSIAGDRELGGFPNLFKDVNLEVSVLF
jgi:hypothetical protein